MSFKLSAKSWERVHAYQREEIVRLASDRDHVRVISRYPYYARIGDLLGSGPGRVLEIGCGPGRYVALLASLGWDVVGADPCRFPSWEAISKYRVVTWDEGVYAENLPYPDGSFDAVACLGALLYFKDPKLAFSEIFRVLKPGGRILVRSVNRTNLFRLVHRRDIDPATVSSYSERELADFVRSSGFDVSSTFSYGFYPPVLPGTWWYLVNGTIPISVQDAFSALTPPRYRVNVVAVGTRR
ncbi:class I SAM-dependent methyltransferase [Bradyrhizobium jicamae]|uniref:class I SAM-dependent methyltransferase n=1 Tax=Bradyrhizobium jicamae TaxID=280332 RepID=UPI001BACA522|nr:class I SAM-dependent methyltransferase [Bradyrhizobium jicamae]